MDWLTVFLSQAGTQLAAIALILVGIQKYTGIDLGSMARSFLGIRDKDSAEQATASLRNDFQKLLNEQEVLAQHFNHETTDALIRIREAIDRQNDVGMRTNQMLHEIIEYGVKTRKK